MVIFVIFCHLRGVLMIRAMQSTTDSTLRDFANRVPFFVIARLACGKAKQSKFFRHCEGES